MHVEGDVRKATSCKNTQGKRFKQENSRTCWSAILVSNKSSNEKYVCAIKQAH